MTKIKSQPRHSQAYQRYQLWWDKLMALIILFNYVLVIFNLTYIPFRDFWLQGRVQFFFKFGQWEFNIPNPPLQVLPASLSQLITRYDVFKGIEPYRSTKQYLDRVEDLEKEINLYGLQQPNPKIESILADLRERSIEMIDTNPFLVANKTGQLERIKNKMRDHVFDNKDASSKQSFEIFWSRDYLLKNDPRQQLNFFDQQIAPLIATNYYRSIGENGHPVDNFGLIDFLFFVIFLPDFLLKTWLLSRRYSGISWFDAMLWRWYDIFLLIPVWRWLRIITLTIRLNQAKIIDLKAIQKQASQGFVASIAEDITEVVVIRIINQLQDSVKDGVIQDFLLQQNNKQYIDLNNTNEMVEIVQLMLQVIVNQVLPKLQPEAEAFLQFNFDKAIVQTPAYQNLEKLPGVKSLQAQFTQQLASRSYQILCEVLKKLLAEDPKFNQLLEALIKSFSKTVGSELQTQASMEQLELLITDLLEEIKINYVQRLSEEDVESILDQTRAIRAKKDDKVI